MTTPDFPLCQVCGEPIWQPDGHGPDGRPKLVACRCHLKPEPVMSWNHERLNATVEEWHKRLALGAWIVGAKFVHESELCPEHEAEVDINDEHRMARIRVMTPGAHGPDFLEQPWDVERAIVHELMHLHEHPLRQAMDEALRHCAPAVKDTIWRQYDMAREQMINTLARVLVNTKRGAAG